MFERFTETARRVIFFARYHASQFGSSYIASEHLLLGVIAEDRVLAARLRELEHRLFGPVDEHHRFAGPLEAEPLDLRSDPDQAPERRHLADDLRVVRGVRRCRDERGELVDPDPAADSLELTALLELVDEGDRVDGLALCVQGECRAIDLRVALAVEIARVEHFRHCPDGAGGEQHRPEHRLLGFEVLRRHRGGPGMRPGGRIVRKWGDCHRAIQQAVPNMGKDCG